MKHLSLDLVHATESAAIAASSWIGTGEKELADKAATDAMRDRLNSVHFCAKIVVGEGLKDRSFGLYRGETVGSNIHENPLVYEICVDPIEGTRPTVTSGPEAISVIGIANEGGILHIEDFYVLKLAFGPKLMNDPPSIEMPLDKLLFHTAYVLKKPIDRTVVCILDRPRHRDIIKTMREIGVRIKLIQDCDVSGAVATCLPESGVDLLYGIGGAPEASITACAMKCLGGGIIVRIGDSTESLKDIIHRDELVRGECALAATGITDGSILRGVRYNEIGAITHSVFMRSESGTVRWMKTHHGN